MSMNKSKAGIACALAPVMSALADKTRLTILMELTNGEQNVTDLVVKLALPQPTVSHHLSLLRFNRLVTPRRSGKRIHYTLGPAARAVGDGAIDVTHDGIVVRVMPDLT